MVKFGNFKIEDILVWQPQKEIDPLEIKNLTVKSENKYPFYGQATINNGIISYLSLTDEVLNNKDGKPTILIHSNNQNIVYLETPFYLKDGHGATSVLQSDFLNEKIALYIMACIKKVIIKNFTYNEKATKIALKNTIISLPVNLKDEVDYDYMEKYIEKVESEKTNLFLEYLKRKKLDKFILSEQEQQALNLFKDNKLIYKNFKIGDLFDISSSKKKFNANTVKFDGKHPYVVRSSNNNGIRGYINENIEFLNEGKTISFGQDTATIFYQENPYFTGDKIKIMKYLKKELTPELGCYLITCMRKSFKNFAWGSSSFNEDILKNVEIKLPINSLKEIDYNYIDHFIRAQEKLILKKVM